MSKDFINLSNNNEQKKENLFNELYFSSLEELKQNKDYISANQKIELYKKILLNNYNVNIDIIEELISSVEDKVELEYENFIEKIKK